MCTYFISFLLYSRFHQKIITNFDLYRALYVSWAEHYGKEKRICNRNNRAIIWCCYLHFLFPHIACFSYYICIYSALKKKNIWWPRMLYIQTASWLTSYLQVSCNAPYAHVRMHVSNYNAASFLKIQIKKYIALLSRESSGDLKKICIFNCK